MTTVAYDTIGSATRSASSASVDHVGARRALGWSAAFVTGIAIWGGIITGIVALVSTLS